MDHIREQHAAIVQEVIKAYKTLRRKMPNHGLLNLVTLSEDEQRISLSPEIYNRCLPNGYSGQYPATGALVNYYHALDNAADGRSYRLPPPSPLETTG